jgi:hypothetical protein
LITFESCLSHCERHPADRGPCRVTFMLASLVTYSHVSSSVGYSCLVPIFSSVR